MSHPYDTWKCGDCGDYRDRCGCQEESKIKRLRAENKILKEKIRTLEKELEYWRRKPAAPADLVGAKDGGTE